MPAKQKVPFTKAMEIAADLEQKLKRAYQNVQIAGSLRRQKPIIGDIDIVVDGPTSKAAPLLETTVHGAHEIYGYYQNMHVNVYSADRAHWGAMIMFLTGPNHWNIGMRIRARRLGLKLSQYGVFANPEVWATIQEAHAVKLDDETTIAKVREANPTADLFNKTSLHLLLKTSTKIQQGQPIAARTEKSIFTALQKPYKEPSMRGK